jgi:uncharacterized membrane protein SpoIIM required for sporulation
MKQHAFEERYRTRWTEFETWLAPYKSANKDARKEARRANVTAEWPARYREIAQHLALARERAYSPELVDKLNHLVLQGHQVLYGARSEAWSSITHFVARGFPQLVRAEWRVVVLACVLLFLPLLGLIAQLQVTPSFIYTLQDASTIREYEQMYSPSNRKPGVGPNAGGQVQMLGHYIWNNVKIDFQCFAGGLVFGIGSVFFLIFNGVMIGATAGHLTQLGYIETFWGFVAGHSSWELLGAALSGAAGLKIGWALIAPGRQTRIAALKAASKVAVRILYGAAGMTFVAAFIEAFWSPLTSIPFPVKIGFGLLWWGLFALYFFFAGRGAARHAD